MPLLDLLFSMLWFFLVIAWIWLVISIFIDIFRSDDLSGWGKAGWLIVVLIVPLLGVLIYVIARGHSMTERRAGDYRRQEEATQQYIREAAGSTSTADELAKLAKLRDDGTLTEDEYQTQKAKLLG